MKKSILAACVAVALCGNAGFAQDKPVSKTTTTTMSKKSTPMKTKTTTTTTHTKHTKHS